MVQEIEIPLDLKRVVLMGAEETKLGDKKGALKQYRKGNLHIREYACLLYTSPSPRDRTRSRMPSSA